MQLWTLRTLDEFTSLVARDADNMQAHMRRIESFVPPDRSPFTIPGFSYTAGKRVNFAVDFKPLNLDFVLWREQVSCPLTAFNNRMRSTIHMLDLMARLNAKSDVYLTEQVTPMYAYLKPKYPRLIGSEFVSPDTPPGTVREDGVRHEDVTRLSMADNSLDAIISLDVLEHVPDFGAAFAECCRTLRPGGRLIWTVPFAEYSAPHAILAKVRPDGSIEHFGEPEYHGNPMSEEGALCFQHFGWDMLKEVREAGFRDAWSATFYSFELGYLGGYQHMFIAEK